MNSLHGNNNSSNILPKVSEINYIVISVILLIFCYLRYVSRTRLEQRTRRKYITIYECCSGYRQEGSECPIGEANYCMLIV